MARRRAALLLSALAPLRLALAVAGLALPRGGWAADPAFPAILTPLAHQVQAPASLPPVVQETLPNGLRVLILERRAAPVIAFRVYFDVGSVNDPQGLTGLAHLFEHMIFKGTKTINSKGWTRESPLIEKAEAAGKALIDEESKREPDLAQVKALRDALEKAQAAADEASEKDEYERILEEAGAAGLNAMTGSDFTAYQVSLPSNRLELWMAMESDRFQNPVLREFYRERDVVMEERRMNYESRPSGKLWENFNTHAFVAHPYHNEGIGWMSDLKRITAQDARDFFKANYGPASAVIAIVGDVDAKRTLEMFRKYFGPIPAGERAKPRFTDEPVQEGERRVVVRFEAQPKLFIGWHRPDGRHPDQPVYEMINSLLGTGRTSRLYKALVEGKQLAEEVGTDLTTPGMKYPCLFFIAGHPRAPHTTAELEQGIYEELEKLAKGPIPAEELQKVRNQLEVDLVKKMEDNEGMADTLGFYEALAGDWRYQWKLKDRLAQVTETDIHRVAAATFRAENRTVATLVPGGGKAEGGR